MEMQKDMRLVCLSADLMEMKTVEMMEMKTEMRSAQLTAIQTELRLVSLSDGLMAMQTEMMMEMGLV